jgi:4-cresol dehydrogenase (hydroxylating)
MVTEEVLEKFSVKIGKENVITDRQLLTQAELTNYPTTQNIPLILRPSSVEELKECVLIAKQYKQSIYPVSAGKNWGYGSRVPVKDNNIILELKQLNRIIDFDEKLGYITIEPGVTFQQVFEFLRKNKSQLILSTTGSSIHSSIVGNSLERGVGTGLYADRFAHVCGLEIMLPDGNIIATGFERYGDIKIGKLHRWGLGPSLDGLFTQSNLGIVTKMTIWLMKAPNYFHFAFYKINGKEKLEKLIDSLQEMMMEGIIRPAVTV